ncbi:adventurous-gliding motility protein Z-like [Galleria mellonella]|uniref:Adventurous-gliding motility protein Z-like n=1 Tax=Galleria mellonella TaxID=7137 RepID=A0ABM3MZL8_GALME|nr:adventurous-gliding motility protein Z-like [Galleria mellonella]
MSEIMMFNGLIMCGDSDTSDFAKESACTSSAAGSGECEAAARAQYYHNKLLATLQILRNKEETVRVQSESLQLAEARIAALTERAAALRADLNAKALELRTLRDVVDAKTDKNDASVTTEIQEAEKQKSIVHTLQNNLSVIEELYRECFYETAKQEELIEMLRKSCLDVRLMDREKAEQIGRLQSVIYTQKWSLERCQNIATEVDSLKVEISNFLNSSNNDSGMWERCEDSLTTEVSEELHDITEQLLQLRAMLTGDCTCGLEEENMRLKRENEAIEAQNGELRQRICDLEASLSDKEKVDTRYQMQLEEKEKELENVRDQLKALNDSLTEKSTMCDTLTRQILQTQVLLSDKTAELQEVQRQCSAREEELQKVQEELDKANNVIKESGEIRGEVTRLSWQVRRWREQLACSERRTAALDAQLQHARDHCREVHACYREKMQCARELQAQLEEAHERGGRLCEQARRALAALRPWLRRLRARHSEQEEKIQEQEALIDMLQKRLQESPNFQQSNNRSRSCCSKCICWRERATSTGTFTCPLRTEERWCDLGRLNASEIASGSSAPVPPKRMLRKKAPSCPDRRRSRGRVREAAVQRPVRCDVATDSDSVPPRSPDYVPRSPFDTLPRSVSPSEAVLQRVERLQALCGHRPHT